LELYLKGDILVDKTCVGGNPNESKYGVLKGCILYAMDKIDESTEACNQVIKLD
jgi:hypothetical protein